MHLPTETVIRFPLPLTMTWITYSFGAMFSFACALWLMRVAGQGGVSISQMMATVTGVCSLYALIQAVVGPEGLHNLSTKYWIILFVIGLLLGVGNFCQGKALVMSPNPGYAIAIIGSSSVLLTVAGLVIGGANFSIKAIIGVAFCITGVVLVALK